MVILMTTGDFLAMASTTDNVRPSLRPNAWRIDALTIAGIIMAACNLVFCSGVLAIGKFTLDLDTDALRTLAAIVLVFSGQGVLYVVRERRHFWGSRPSVWLLASSVIDVAIIATLAICGIFMASLSPQVVAATLAASVVFALALDVVKFSLFKRLNMAEEE
jgi:H+-transporting ATPase